MQVLLAGYNIDSEVIDELKQLSPDRQDVTPETLSASYARISRDPRPIYELRKAARGEVEKARRSNSSIIFKMGHHSVAEHAVFNFDIIGLSRYAVESVEHHRLCSFTEKSQRYITLDKDFVVPEEIKGTKSEAIFVDTIKQQNALYGKLNEELLVQVRKNNKDLAQDPKNDALLEGWAKEDARYVTPLATKAQLGLTVNARNLELMLRRFESQENSEIKQLSKNIHSLVQKIAPSIILFASANDYDLKTYSDLRSLSGMDEKRKTSDAGKYVKLVDSTKDADSMLVASLLFAVSGRTFADCLEKASAMSVKERTEMVKASCKNMQFYDTVLREYENIDLTFEVVLSSACFGQLKRHRMATIIKQGYDTSLGVTVPPSVKELGKEQEFMDVVRSSEKAFEAIQGVSKIAAPYILTNAHRRRVLFKCNARELYHVSRLREDRHAQWDIRDITEAMTEEAKKAMPLTMMFIGGKDAYPEIYKKAFA